MLPKPMRDLEKDEVKWFVEVDGRAFTETDIKKAKKSLEVFRSIKTKK